MNAMNNTTIETPNGVFEIDAKLFNGYLDESAKHYRAISYAKNDLKLIGEALEEKVGLKAGVIMKYIQAKVKDSTKEAKELGELYEQLDGAIGD